MAKRKRKSTPASLDWQRLKAELLRSRAARFPAVEAERDDARARAAAAEAGLKPYRGGRKLKVHGEVVQDRAALAAKVYAAVERARERERKEARLRWKPEPREVFADVNEEFGRTRKSTWAWQLYREHARTLTKQ
jgi:hypothetical protein